jgi:hypothetical protein
MSRAPGQRQGYWEQHPAQLAFLQAFLSGEWVTRAFAWFYMMVSRFAGPTMTIAVGYLMLYAIDSHHGLAAPVAHPSFSDSLAQAASGIINVTPELVFPGTVVLAIRALLCKNWLHASLYGVASVMFAALTILLLDAFMTGRITDSFLSGMLLWRAISALSYTVVAEVCSHHGGEGQPSVQQQQNQQTRLDDLTVQVEHLTAELSHLSTNVQDRLHESANVLASNLQLQLATELAAMKESLQRDGEKLAHRAPVKAQQHRETRTTQPLEGQITASGQTAQKRPLLRALPIPGSESKQEKQVAFDARAFVFSCLQDQPGAKLAEIESAARAHGHELSQATISRYRKQFLAHRESTILASDESSTMQV